MNWLSLSFRNLAAKKYETLLNIVLLAFGTGIIATIMLVSAQVGAKLAAGDQGIDAVVGAKGSPIQLILSSIYHIDFPTGNISLEDAEEVMKNPLVKKAVPLSLGDAYGNFRIVGTTPQFPELYGLEVENGVLWQHPFEACVGANVARARQLKIGDRIISSHGLTSGGHAHEESPYVVTGIFAKSGTVADNLVLTSTESVWAMHAEHEHHTEHEHDAVHGHDAVHEHDTRHEHDEGHDTAGAGPYQSIQSDRKQITALLIRYRSPSAIVSFPRYINQQTNMQAVSPAQESARLFSLLGIGLDVIRWFGWLLIAISVFSVFISLYNSLKERKYDLAIMRSMGASRGKLFLLVMAEGMLLTILATTAGLAWSHLAVELTGRYQETEQARLTGGLFLNAEYWLLAGGLLLGALASVLPAVQAYRTDIPAILAKNN